MMLSAFSSLRERNLKILLLGTLILSMTTFPKETPATRTVYVLEDVADTETHAVVIVNLLVNNNNNNQVCSVLCLLPWSLQVPLVVFFSSLLTSSSECYNR